MEEDNGFYGLCETVFWDSNLTWYTSNPDFTPCFQHTVLVWLPCAFLWIFLLPEIQTFRRSKRAHIPWTFLNITKMIANVALLVVNALKIAYDVYQKQPFLIHCLPSLIKLLTEGLAFSLMLSGRARGIRRSGLLFVYWCLSTVTGIISIRSIISLTLNEGHIENVITFSLFIAEFSSVALLLILSSLLDAKPQYEKPPNTDFLSDETESPEEHASFISQLSFSWLNKLINTGYRREIKSSDIPKLQRNLNVKNTNFQLEKHMFKNSLISKETKNADEREELKKNTPIFNIESALMKAFGPSLIFIALVQMGADIISLILPLIIKWLIEFTSSASPMWHGILFVILLTITSFIRNTISDYRLKLALTLSSALRSSTVSSLYKKCLRLSHKSRSDFASGTILNCMSVDSVRLAFVAISYHLIISFPVTIVIATYLLWTLLGVSALVGIISVILSVPFLQLLANTSRGYQRDVINCKDKRIKLMSEILNGARVLKMYAWEESFQARVDELRDQEVILMKKAAILQAISLRVIPLTPYLGSFLCFTMFVLLGYDNVLSPSIAFTTLQILAAVTANSVLLPSFLNDLSMLRVSFKRINGILNGSEIKSYVQTGHSKHKKSTAIEFIDGYFTWDSSYEPVVHGISLEFEKGILAAVVGKVGSGKTSLLSSVLGETEKCRGEITVNGTVAYCPQQAWIQNASLKNNILFHSEMERETYETILEACALEEDIDILPAFDETEIGEKGINLSGGQKQRVSLARAVYLDRDIYLLDDPLGAVDTHTANHLFERVIGPNGLLKNKTRIVVTHNLSLLPHFDVVYVMDNGKIEGKGTYEELLEKEGPFKDLLNELNKEGIKNKGMVQEDKSKAVITKYISKREETFGKKDEMVGKKIISEEKIIQSRGAFSVGWQYFNLIGLKSCLAIFIGFSCAYALSVFSNYWLVLWTADSQSSYVGQSNATMSKIKRLSIFGTINLAHFSISLVSGVFLLILMLNAAVKMNRKLLESVLRSPLAFFDTTPVGRILNRFTSDIQEADQGINISLLMSIAYVFQTVSLFIAVMVEIPFFALAIVVCLVPFIFIKVYYSKAHRQFKNLYVNSNSPLFTHFSDTLAGASVIRSLKATDIFTEKAFSLIEDNEAKYYLWTMSVRWYMYCVDVQVIFKYFFLAIIIIRWMTFRVNLLLSVLLLIAYLWAILSKDFLSPGIVGYILNNLNTIAPLVFRILLYGTQVEASFVSLERIFEYFKLNPEADWNKPRALLPKQWPEKGQIIFRNYSTRYREGLDLVLNNISFVVNPMEKVGVVGRTGAGKSSLALALFRMIEPANGEIIIDGQDISQLGLHDLRSRITIIPQDPVLYSGTLRFNLDPFNLNSDDELWTALELAHLKSLVKTYKNGLSHEMMEGGQNLSVGQRQLVCLARALVRKTKILVMDEATASVDMETDDLIQATIRDQFQSCTIITIAHRINTIMDYDRVLVLSQGKIVEFGAPRDLKRDSKSWFYNLSKYSGLEKQ